MDSLRSKANGEIWIDKDINKYNFRWDGGDTIIIVDAFIFHYPFETEQDKLVQIDNNFIIHVGPYDLIPIGFDDNCILAKRINDYMF